MNETSKTNRIRGEQFIKRYFSGRVLDIGCGSDLVVPHAEPFDLAQGDANRIGEFRTAESYDCVHSSHCLEHMEKPEEAIEGWWRLVAPGGYLVVVVPDEDIYEQGVWPSRFNADHKATFRLDVKDTWSPCSHDILNVVKSLPGAEMVSAELQDQGYDRGLARQGPESAWSNFLRANMMKLYHKLSSKGLLSMELLEELNRFFFELGATVDQTIGPALAQIQVVAQKRS